MKAKLSRRSVLGGMLAALGGLLGWRSLVSADARSKLAHETRTGYEPMRGIKSYSYDATPISHAADDQSSQVVERFTYDCHGGLVEHVRFV